MFMVAAHHASDISPSPLQRKLTIIHFSLDLFVASEAIILMIIKINDVYYELLWKTIHYCKKMK